MDFRGRQLIIIVVQNIKKIVWRVAQKKNFVQGVPRGIRGEIFHRGSRGGKILFRLFLHPPQIINGRPLTYFLLPIHLVKMGVLELLFVSQSVFQLIVKIITFPLNSLRYNCYHLRIGSNRATVYTSSY